MTRRDFFGRFGLGLGGMALDGACWRKVRLRRDRQPVPRHPATAPFRAQGEADHLPVHERRPVAARPVRLQAAAEPDERPGPARLASAWASGSPACRPTRRRCRWPARSSSSPSTARAAPGSASCCRGRRRSPTSCASSSRCTPRRSTTTRRSRSSRPATSSPAGRAWARGSATAWAARTRTCPAFVVLISQGPHRPAALRAALGQRLPADASTRACSSAAASDPVLYLEEPRRRLARRAGARCSTASPSCTRCSTTDLGDPEINARIAQYEMAYRMQTSVPEVMDLSQRAGRARSSCTAPTRRQPGTFAANCLLARRLAERDVRFIQLYHPGWDQHGGLPERHPPAVPGRRPRRLRADHRPEAARPARRHAGRLGRRIRPHELLAGQADRRPTTAATITRAASPIWMAGGGIKPGITYGATDDFGYNVAENPSTSTTSRPRSCTCSASTTSG